MLMGCERCLGASDLIHIGIGAVICGMTINGRCRSVADRKLFIISSFRHSGSGNEFKWKAFAVLPRCITPNSTLSTPSQVVAVAHYSLQFAPLSRGYGFMVPVIRARLLYNVWYMTCCWVYSIAMAWYRICGDKLCCEKKTPRIRIYI